MSRSTRSTIPSSVLNAFPPPPPKSKKLPPPPLKLNSTRAPAPATTLKKPATQTCSRTVPPQKPILPPASVMASTLKTRRRSRSTGETLTMAHSQSVSSRQATPTSARDHRAIPQPSQPTRPLAIPHRVPPPQVPPASVSRVAQRPPVIKPTTTRNVKREPSLYMDPRVPPLPPPLRRKRPKYVPSGPPEWDGDIANGDARWKYEKWFLRNNPQHKRADVVGSWIEWDENNKVVPKPDAPPDDPNKCYVDRHGFLQPKQEANTSATWPGRGSNRQQNASEHGLRRPSSVPDLRNEPPSSPTDSVHKRVDLLLSVLRLLAFPFRRKKKEKVIDPDPRPVMALPHKGERYNVNDAWARREARRAHQKACREWHARHPDVPAPRLPSPDPYSVNKRPTKIHPRPDSSEPYRYGTPTASWISHAEPNASS